MKLSDLLLCAGFSLSLPVGQALFKWSANVYGTQTGSLLFKLTHNLPLFLALSWYGMSAFFWFYILTRIPLSAAYPIAILGSALVPVFAWLFFRERLSPDLILGYALMLAGLYVIQRSSL